MKYIKPSNMKFLRDREESLNVLANLAHAAQGDARVRDSILAKIEKYRSVDRAQYAETELPDGAVRLRHPAIGVVSVDHHVLPAPTVLFGTPSKSLTAYTLTVSRAEATITPEGLIMYAPYEVVGQFQLSELSYNTMVTSSGSVDSPVTIEKLAGYRIEPTIPSAFTSQARHLATKIQGIVDGMTGRLEQLTTDFEELGVKGGKLSQKTIDALQRSTIPEVSSLTRNLSFQISKVAEFSQEVTTSQRAEVESLISLRKTQGGK
ncbi:hypothetical protein [Pseudomonas sp. S1(2024)]|uniref:hypothetical protein n=1 Tax=Pseudomonas sp. S1(2024) TaxID=3390191 RepID=UPI0039797E04